jgi:hypothetical protein
MKKLITYISFFITRITLLGIITTGTALAHSGHINLEQIHGFLHTEHLILLIGIIVAFIVNAIINKRF